MYEWIQRFTEGKLKETRSSLDYKIMRYEIQKMSEIRDFPRYYIISSSPTLCRVRIVKLSKYQITFLIEFTKSLRATFNNANGAGALKILSTSRISGYKSRVFIPVGRRRGRQRRGRLLREWRRGLDTGVGRDRGGEGNKDVHVETATTTEFLHAVKSGLLTERRNWMHLLLHAGVCAHIHTFPHTHSHMHTRNTRTSYGLVMNTRVGPSEIRADLIFNLFPSIWKMENAIRGLRGPRFARHAYRRICAWKKKESLRNEKRDFFAFSYPVLEFSREIESTNLVTRNTETWIFINLIMILFYRYKSVVCRVYFYTLILIRQSVNDFALIFRTEYSFAFN